MKRKTQLLLMGLVFSVLLGGSLTGTRQGHAAPPTFDCLSDLWDDWTAADQTYTTTFLSWYRGIPVTCETQCSSTTCQGLTGAALDACMNNCLNGCNSSRFSAFQSAQEGLLDVARRSCPITLDRCDEARAMKDVCNSTYNSHLANPVLDENGNYDFTWLSAVFEQYSACIAASGIEMCE